MVLVSGYRPSGWPAPAREPFTGWQAVGPGPIGKRLAYSCPSWRIRLVCFRSACRDPWKNVSVRGPVQAAQLTLQRSILQLLRNDTALARHRKFPPGGRR
jgi:hypothetical protein